MARSSGSVCRGSNPSARTIARKGSMTFQTPQSVVGRADHTGLKSKASEPSLPTRYAANITSPTPTVSSPKSSRFRQKGARNFDGAASSTYEDTEDRRQELNESSVVNTPHTPRIRKRKSSRMSLFHQLLPTSSKISLNTSFRGIPISERSVADNTIVPQDIDRTPRPASKSGSATRCTGKVSDLRKIFERYSTRGSPQGSFKSFWQSRSRSKPVEERDKIYTTEFDGAGSSTSLATYMAPLKRISVPELTTEISTNDFSCDFAETFGNVGLAKPKAHFDTEQDEITVVKQESPVKDRIQQFERLERGSPATSPTPYCRTKSFDANSNISIRGKGNDTRLTKTGANWRPFRQRSLELWRRISSTLTRVGDGGNDGIDNREQAKFSDHVDTNDSRPQPSRGQLRYRRSAQFGYHLHRTSAVVRSSNTSFHSRSNININDELTARFERQPPYLAYTRSRSRQLPIRRAFPFLARMSDDLGCADELDGFGFDGTVMSRAIKRRGNSSDARVPQTPDASSSSPTHVGDPNALSRVVSQQTIAERKRRRLEEKQVRREQKEKKREEKSKGKGKAKEDGVESNDDEQKADNNTRDKGKKGKETDGKKKESSWSKKTASGFVVRQINDIKLKHPKPRRPGQVKKIVNMYKEKASSGIKLGKGSGVSSGSGAGATAGGAADN